MYKINLTEAETCLAALVKEAANGEKVVITQEDGSAFQLVPIANAPGSSESDQGKLFNPEGLWDQNNANNRSRHSRSPKRDVA